MAKFSIGYNHDEKFLMLIGLFKDYLSEVYFPSSYDVMASGRAVKHEKNYEKNIKKIIGECKKHGISSNMLLNATCEGESAGEKFHADAIIRYLKTLENIGLSSVTVTNPIHIPRIKKETSLEIHASVNCYTKNAEHARYLKDLGADVITVDRDINRNIELIKKIKEKTGAKIKILLNEGCLKNCPFRNAHFNLISHRKDTDYFDSASCINIYRKDPKKAFLIPFIRPEDVKHYKGAADYFKLATRTTPTAKIPIIMAAYIKQSYSGDLLFILSTKGLFGAFERIDNKALNENSFYEKLWNCKENCDTCGYCEDLLKKAAVLRE